MIDVSMGIAVGIAAFCCEYVDSTLGMGYGTALTPTLLLFGFAPMQIIPVVLLSELVTGFLAGFLHHRNGNVNFKPRANNMWIKTGGGANSLVAVGGFTEAIPLHLKVALLLAICSTVGTVAAVSLAVNIPKFWLKLYIGSLVLLMGIIILFCLNRQFKFSWLRIVLLGMIASFNKGMSGGGYGPVVTGGQILSGVEGKNAIGITSLAEGLTSLVGVIAYMMLSNNHVDWKLAPWIIPAAAMSCPLAALTVKRIKTDRLKPAIATLAVLIGSLTILRTLAVGGQ